LRSEFEEKEHQKTSSNTDFSTIFTGYYKTRLSLKKGRRRKYVSKINREVEVSPGTD